MRLRNLFTSDIIFCFLVMIGTLIGLFSLPASVEFAKYGPYFFPSMLLIGLFFFCGLYVFVALISSRPYAEPKEHAQKETKINYKNMLKIFAFFLMLYLYIFSLDKVGFLISSFIAVFFIQYLFTGRVRVFNIIFSFIVPLLVYIVFKVAFKIPIP